MAKNKKTTSLSDADKDKKKAEAEAQRIANIQAKAEKAQKKAEIIAQKKADAEAKAKADADAKRKAEKKAASEDLVSTGEMIGMAGEAWTSMFSDPAIKAFSFAINIAAKAETIGIRFNKVFEGMEEETKSWAETQATSIGKSVIDIQGYLMDTQEMLTGMGSTKEESVELSKKIVALGLDYASFHNISDDSAIESLSMAITGNTDAFEALGIMVDDNVLSLGLQNMQIGENQKQQAIYDAILKQSGDVLGYSEQRIGTFAGQLERLKAITEITAIKFGDVLLPILTEIITKVGEVVNWFGQLNEGAQFLIIGIGAFAMVMGPLLSMISSIVIIIGVLGATSVWLFAIPAIIIGLVTLFTFLYKKFEGFRNAVQSFLSLFKKDTGRDKIMEDGFHGFNKGADPKIEDDVFYAYHIGTNYHPGGLALVGERGPELLNLPKGSKVATNYRTERYLSRTGSTSIDGSIESNISSSSINMPFAPQIVVNVEGSEEKDTKTTLIKREVKEQILPMLEEYFSIMRLKHPILIER